MTKRAGSADSGTPVVHTGRGGAHPTPALRKWSSSSGACDRCGRESKRRFPAFGKMICTACKDARPNKGKGNAGLSGSGQMEIGFAPGLCLERVPKSNGLFGSLFFSHYPQSRGIPGRSLCYLIWENGALKGIIGANSPPFNYRLFREFFKAEERYFLSNNVFRLTDNRRNLGTRVLKAFRHTVRSDYMQKYGEMLIGLVTFVEPPRTGALYRADNWTYLGVSQGKRMVRRESWEKEFLEGTVKHIYAYRYRR